MIFTTSKDSTLKGFFYDSLSTTYSEYDFKISHSVNDLNYAFQINYLLFGTYSSDSS